MAVKITLFFTLDKYSWTEDHIDLSASSGFLISEQPRAQQLANLRSQLLGYDAQLERIRISAIPANQAVIDVEFAGNLMPSWTLGNASTVGYSATRAYQALLMRLQSNAGLHRNYYMAAAPYGLFRSRLGDDTGVDFSQIPEFLLRLLAFTQFLTSGGWGWQSRAQPVLTQALGLVTNAAFPGMLGIQVGAALAGVAVGTLLQVSGWRRVSVKTSPPLTGVYKCGGVLAPVAPATTWTYFLFNTTTIPPSNFFTLGKVGALVLASVPYQFASPVEATQRKRGATALRPRGRARAQF